jgi:hypothetical protein
VGNGWLNKIKIKKKKKKKKGQTLVQGPGGKVNVRCDPQPDNREHG